MINKYFPLSLLSIFFFSCEQEQEQTNEIPQGRYRAAIELQGQEVPFFIEFDGDENNLQAYILNSDERLETDASINGDSVILEMNVFDASLRGKFENGKINGEWVKHYVDNYRAPFTANQSDSNPRFSTDGEAEHDFSGRWETYFNLGNGDPRPAVGKFTQEGSSLQGSFALPSGDFRYLEGNVDGNTFYLSTFNGEEAKLFIGELDENGKVTGKYFNGLTGNYSFTATRNEGFNLPDKDREVASETIDFTYPDLDGNDVSLSDYRGKPVLVQIFGSWCPNCMDETKYMGEWYEENKDKVEIVALAFEKKDDFDYAKNRVQKSSERLGANYPFLIAGQEKDLKAAFPQVEGPLYFPSMLYVDSEGRLVDVHTGFNGPSTGELFEEWKKEHDEKVEKLVKG
ncbi:TlpA family protein disulfide reductase [Litoribacter alkaliphilus]|uniref:TlpA family protein disulfide reductase n=1 Tax=Litoribacter ruber TaxID=702568 RepID=A0AAP2CLI7_9BACT|nr:TlpA disulfide reductase family protein [Litoribacter alkaliphilus]MBS9525461.1 TlpA family protein disulfide reductase [Litoribacter alkaliphilus]